MRYHVIALTIGFLLDLKLGDPWHWPHIVKFFGNRIAGGERVLRKLMPNSRQGEVWGGTLLVLWILLLAAALPGAVLWCCYHVHWLLGLLTESLLCYQLLAMKGLKQESMKVYDQLKQQNLPGARQAVSMIVGRDTQHLDETGVTKAAVETVAENASDGVIAPMFYILLGGGVLGAMYKAINTMDSMLGYKNERYLYWGRTAAKLDDVVNYLPARLTGLLLVAAAGLQGLDGKNSWRIFCRDRYNHASPNSAHGEAACAGALHVQLAGDAWYFGQLYKKPLIGDADRPIESEDIRRANRLLYGAGWLMLALCWLAAGIFLWIG